MKTPLYLRLTFATVFAFSIQAQASVKYQLLVAQDGSADYTSIQDAINDTKSFPDKQIQIRIKNGIYHEKVNLYAWNPRVALIGESKDKTIIEFADHFKHINKGRNSTFLTATLEVNADDTLIKNLTIKNNAGPVGQAIALAVNANRVVVDNVAIIGNQDSLYVSGEGNLQLFKNCYVEGTTDFIFGNASAVFDHCHIHAKSSSYITAASTDDNAPFGLVFLHNKVTLGNGIDQVYLGRPWRPYAQTVWIDSQLPAGIHPEGWHDWSKPQVHHTSFYAEFNNVGAGANTDKRVSWSHQLTGKQAKKYQLDNLLNQAGYTNWYLRDATFLK
ncbi:pectinesterase family protein [Neptunicella marina]|uniref:Pectinesterase n=1 Tax=Neptunicella marina TaxID=2125989 RepID=A0A8J6IX68_9ALTE|nr:pectinesterase family protein [Neptunicella marina]MBC3766998.1 pectin esterase [Neptunicella marina]